MTTNRPKCASPKCELQASNRSHGYCIKHAYATGAIRPRVDSTMARQKLLTLLEAGSTLPSISEAIGVDSTTLHRIRHGESKTILRKNHDAIMQADPRKTIITVPAWQLTRRIRALRAAGWTLQDLADHTGLTKTHLSRISCGDSTRVLRRTAIAIRDAYTDLSAKPIRPASTNIQRRRWALPFEWDNIDDPNEHRDKPPMGDHYPVFVRDEIVKIDGLIHTKLNELIDHYGTRKQTSIALGFHGDRVAYILSGKSPTISLDYYLTIMNHQPQPQPEQEGAA